MCTDIYLYISTLYKCTYKVAIETDIYIYIYIYCVCSAQMCTTYRPDLCSLECVLSRSYVTYVHQLRVSSLGSYVCSPFEGVLSGSHGQPYTYVSIEGVLGWGSVGHGFIEEGVLSVCRHE